MRVWISSTFGAHKLLSVEHCQHDLGCSDHALVNRIPPVALNVTHSMACLPNIGKVTCP
jgi:hypothetical protein